MAVEDRPPWSPCSQPTFYMYWILVTSWVQFFLLPVGGFVSFVSPLYLLFYMILFAIAIYHTVAIFLFQKRLLWIALIIQVILPPLTIVVTVVMYATSSSWYATLYGPMIVYLLVVGVQCVTAVFIYLLVRFL